jgi:hypothetical protein
MHPSYKSLVMLILFLPIHCVPRRSTDASIISNREQVRVHLTTTMQVADDMGTKDKDFSFDFQVDGCQSSYKSTVHLSSTLPPQFPLLKGDHGCHLKLLNVTDKNGVVFSNSKPDSDHNGSVYQLHPDQSSPLVLFVTVQQTLTGDEDYEKDLHVQYVFSEHLSTENAVYTITEEKICEALKERSIPQGATPEWLFNNTQECIRSCALPAVRKHLTESIYQSEYDGFKKIITTCTDHFLRAGPGGTIAESSSKRLNCLTDGETYTLANLFLAKDAPRLFLNTCLYQSRWQSAYQQDRNKTDAGEFTSACIGKMEQCWQLLSYPQNYLQHPDSVNALAGDESSMCPDITPDKHHLIFTRVLHNIRDTPAMCSPYLSSYSWNRYNSEPLPDMNAPDVKVNHNRCLNYDMWLRYDWDKDVGVHKSDPKYISPNMIQSHPVEPEFLTRLNQSQLYITGESKKDPKTLSDVFHRLWQQPSWINDRPQDDKTVYCFLSGFMGSSPSYFGDQKNSMIELPPTANQTLSNFCYANPVFNKTAAPKSLRDKNIALLSLQEFGAFKVLLTQELGYRLLSTCQQHVYSKTQKQAETDWKAACPSPQDMGCMVTFMVNRLKDLPSYNRDHWENGKRVTGAKSTYLKGEIEGKIKETCKDGALCSEVSTRFIKMLAGYGVEQQCPAMTFYSLSKAKREFFNLCHHLTISQFIEKSRGLLLSLPDSEKDLFFHDPISYLCAFASHKE